MKIFTHCTNWLIRFIHIQLFITLASMPVLIYWGLPISIMTLVSNLIFTPFLMIFLLVASLVFFSELLHIPNHLLIQILEWVTRCWHKILGHGSPTWLISFAKPSIIIFLGITLGAFGIIHAKKLRNKIHNILGLLFLGILTVVYLKILSAPSTKPLVLECNNGSITLLHANKQTIVIDPGAIGQRFSTASWLEYTLLAELNKQYGASTIDHLIIMQPGKLVLEHIEHLCRCIPVQKIYLVLWKGQADKAFLHSYGTLRRTVEKTGTCLQRIGIKEESIFLSPTDYISIQPLSTELSYKDISFPVLHITGRLAQQSIDIYSKKYKNVDKQKSTVYAADKD